MKAITYDNSAPRPLVVNPWSIDHIFKNQTSDASWLGLTRCQLYWKKSPHAVWDFGHCWSARHTRLRAHARQRNLCSRSNNCNLVTPRRQSIDFDKWCVWSTYDKNARLHGPSLYGSRNTRRHPALLNWSWCHAKGWQRHHPCTCCSLRNNIWDYQSDWTGGRNCC